MTAKEWRTALKLPYEWRARVHAKASANQMTITEWIIDGHRSFLFLTA
jgi:hypothetical protein